MKKINKKYGIIIGVLCLIGLGVFGVYQYSQMERISEKEIQLTDFTQDPIGYLTITQNEELTELVLKDGVWQNSAYETLAYNQELIEEYVEGLTVLKGKQAIFNAKEPSAYGITEKATVIRVRTMGGQDEQFVIGDRIDDEKAYYVWSESEKVIGIIDEHVIKPFTDEAGYWIANDLEMPDVEHVEHITLTKGETTLLDLTKKNEKWMMQEPYVGYGVENEKINDYYSERISLLKKEKFVCVITDESQTYGMNEPQLVLFLNDEKYITFGEVVKDRIYFTYRDEPFIYETDVEQFNNTIVEHPEKWLTGFIYQPEVEMIERIEVKTADQTYIIEKENLQNQELIQMFLDLKVSKKLNDGSIEETNPRQAEVSITYTLKDQTSKVLEFIPYDPSFYLLRNDGKVEFGADKKQVVYIMTALEKLFKKE